MDRLTHQLHASILLGAKSAEACVRSREISQYAEGLNFKAFPAMRSFNVGYLSLDLRNCCADQHDQDAFASRPHLIIKQLSSKIVRKPSDVIDLLEPITFAPSSTDASLPNITRIMSISEFAGIFAVH